MTFDVTVTARAFALGLLVLATPLAQAQEPMAFDTLTVPSDRLPEGCRLSSRNEAQVGVRISSNPWLGNDPSVVVSIRDRVALPPMLPDGPPLSKSELARFRFRLAEDVREAYLAVYTDGVMLFPVYAVRFDGPAQPRVPRRPDEQSGSLQIVRDDTVILITGRGACFDAVADFIKRAVLR